ncbi:uncharacterized protein A4U43_C03F31530 [Asparagus officinalis]|uniref:Transcription factor CBF/NF-Y/archaeal histone domain-containing protein n=1 Tax=Asparagus officinalis TaxID=4686 RepID=A0A5P1FJA7_ASPOF|nr:uncharacterized protein A4U43_C03F31530 [Asparagus officinalis]
MEPMDIVGKSKEDVSLPKATMFKIIKEMLPPDVRVARDAQDLLVECCVEFINLISSESNEVCSREDKRTIAPEHVLKALEMAHNTKLLMCNIALELSDEMVEEGDNFAPKNGLSKGGKFSGAGDDRGEALAEQQSDVLLRLELE